MIKWLTLACTIGGLFVMPGKAATFIVPDGFTYGQPVEQNTVPDPSQINMQQPQIGTLGALFGVANGQATLSNNTLSALGAGVSAPGQFVAVYDPAAASIPGTISGFFNNSDGTSKLRQYLDFMVPIPEPATWAFLVVGMGAAGAALRRKRKRDAIIVDS